MITLLRHGTYTLAATKHDTKILYLDGTPFVWIGAKNIGEVLTVSHYQPRSSDYTLAEGQYKIYDVEDESELTDIQHLELEVGKGAWQGYLLLTGLPSKSKKRTRIVPTTQVIAGNPRFSTTTQSLRWSKRSMIPRPAGIRTRGFA